MTQPILIIFLTVYSLSGLTASDNDPKDLNQLKQFNYNQFLMLPSQGVHQTPAQRPGFSTYYSTFPSYSTPVLYQHPSTVHRPSYQTSGLVYKPPASSFSAIPQAKPSSIHPTTKPPTTKPPTSKPPTTKPPVPTLGQWSRPTSTVKPRSTTFVPAPGFGKPLVETTRVYVDSYLGAAMQAMTYLADLMKNDINTLNKPQKPTTTPRPISTTTRPSTSSHKPGYYSPEKPPSLEVFLKGIEDMNDVEDNHLHLNEILSPDVLDLLRNIHGQEQLDDDLENNVFVKEYDDAKGEFLKARIPPTRAYVTIMSVLDGMNKEAKTLGLSKYQGYSSVMLQALHESSTGTANDQLKLFLQRLLEKKEVNSEGVLKKIKSLYAELEDSNSQVSNMIRYYPPLNFAL